MRNESETDQIISYFLLGTHQRTKLNVNGTLDWLVGGLPTPDSRELSRPQEN